MTSKHIHVTLSNIKIFLVLKNKHLVSKNYTVRSHVPFWGSSKNIFWLMLKNVYYKPEIKLFRLAGIPFDCNHITGCPRRSYKVL